MLIVGGYNGDRQNDTWALDLGTMTWRAAASSR
jgi:hypothetical protein